MRKQERPPIPPSPAVLDRAARSIQFEGRKTSGGSEFAQLKEFAIGRKDAASAARRERRRMTAIIYGEQNEMKAIRAFQRWLRQVERTKPLRKFVVKVSLVDRRPVTRKEKRIAPTVGGRQLPAYNRAVLDRKGRQGVFVGIEYDGAQRHAFGVARRRVLYDINPEHCEKDVRGGAVFFSNMGRDEQEIAIAADVIETTQRATRANAKIGVNIIVQLPHDISQEARLEIMRRVAQELFGQHGLPFVASLHEPSADGDQRNYHGHIWAAWRPVERTGPYQWKISEDFRSDLDGNDYWRHARRAIAETITVVAQSQGLNRTYTHLSNAERGLVHKPQKKLGKVKAEQSRRGEFVADNIANAHIIAASEHAEARLKAGREKRARNRRERLRQVQNGIAPEVTPGSTVARTLPIKTVGPPKVAKVTGPTPFVPAPHPVTPGAGGLEVNLKPLAVSVVDAVAEPIVVASPIAKISGPVPILHAMRPKRPPPSIDLSPKLTPVRPKSGFDITSVPAAVVSKPLAPSVRPISVAARSHRAASIPISAIISINVQSHAQSLGPVKHVQDAAADRRSAVATLQIAVLPPMQANAIAFDLPTIGHFKPLKMVPSIVPFQASAILPTSAVRTHSHLKIKPVETATQQNKLRSQTVAAVMPPVMALPVRVEASTLPAIATSAKQPMAAQSTAIPFPLNVRAVPPVGNDKMASRPNFIEVTPGKPIDRAIAPAAASAIVPTVAAIQALKVQKIAPTAVGITTIKKVAPVVRARMAPVKVVMTTQRSAQIAAASLNTVKPVVLVKPVSVKPVPALSLIKPTAVTLPRPVAVVMLRHSVGQTIRPTRVQAASDIGAVSMSPASPIAGSQKPFALPVLVRPTVAKQAWTSVAPVSVAKPLSANVSKIEPWAVVRPTLEQGRVMPVQPVSLPEHSKPTAMMPIAVKSGRDAEAEVLFRQTHAAMVRLAAAINRRKAELVRKTTVKGPDLPTYTQICFAEAEKQPLDYRIDRLAASMGRGRCELVMTQDGVVEPKVAIIGSWGLTRPDIASPRCQKLLLRQYIHQQIEADQLELELGKQISKPEAAFAPDLLDKAKLSDRAKATADAHYRDGLFGVIRQRIVERSFRGKHVPTREDELRSRGITIDGLSPWEPPRDPGQAPLQRSSLDIDGPSL